MVKNVFIKMNALNPGALVFIGWLAFVCGVLIDEMWLRIILLSAARVLP